MGAERRRCAGAATGLAGLQVLAHGLRLCLLDARVRGWRLRWGLDDGETEGDIAVGEGARLRCRAEEILQVSLGFGREEASLRTLRCPRSRTSVLYPSRSGMMTWLTVSESAVSYGSHIG